MESKGRERRGEGEDKRRENGRVMEERMKVRTGRGYEVRMRRRGKNKRTCGLEERKEEARREDVRTGRAAK